eukprot:TRINITY_DN2681_c0_g1_i10.p3 TRINITY_DN2681_c0_g1~~TRINITY_DN2681_c0_g1_i10.p3  ORF type:complete len:146 (-),score=52.32 TRINITY_DN2681_c0_g1_i10:450-887(-)
MKTCLLFFLFSLALTRLPFLLSEDKVGEILSDFVGDVVTDIRASKNKPIKIANFKCLLAPIVAILKSGNILPLMNSILYTGKQIPDIGDQDSCSLYEETKFVLVTDGDDDKGLKRPVFGICAPRECSLSNLTYMFEPILGTLRCY